MSAFAVVSIGLAAATAVYVLAPLFRKDALEAERVADAASRLLELQSEKDRLLAALKDLDDDRDTGKLDEHDYEEQNGKLTAQAVRTMQELDELEGAPTPEALAPQPGPLPQR